MNNIPNHSKVWIFQAKRAFLNEEKVFILDKLNSFFPNWDAHGTPIKGGIEFVEDRFFIIFADSKYGETSGCSIDSMTKQIKEIEEKFNLGLLDRMLVSFQKNDTIETIKLSEFKNLLRNNILTGDDFIFNLSINKSDELINLKQKISSSWASSFV